jgi:hypothetical protein
VQAVTPQRLETKFPTPQLVQVKAAHHSQLELTTLQVQIHYMEQQKLHHLRTQLFQ